VDLTTTGIFGALFFFWFLRWFVLCSINSYKWLTVDIGPFMVPYKADKNTP
jgi:hypothetical protein